MNKYFNTNRQNGHNRHRIAAALLLLLMPLTLAAQNSLPIKAKITLDKNEVYERETVFFTLTITTTGIQFREKLHLTELPDTRNLDLFTEFENLPVKRTGNGHRVTEIHRYRCRARSLTPGTTTIAPILHLTALRRQRGFIGSFWQEQNLQIQIPATTLHTKRLPPPPKDFSGAVGSLNFNATIFPTDIACGDLITLTTRISGAGYTENITIPRLHNSDMLKVYEPENMTTDSDTTTHEQIIIPQSTNLTAIPKIEFSYFDTRIAKYRTVSAGPFPLKYHTATTASLEKYRPDDVPDSAPDIEEQKPGLILRIKQKLGHARYKQAVCPNTTKAYIAPSNNSLTTFTIPASTEISILEHHRDWLKIESEKKRGWIPAAAINKPDIEL